MLAAASQANMNFEQQYIICTNKQYMKDLGKTRDSSQGDCVQ